MKVGFIGLGVQGKYLAINIAEAGYDLMAYDLQSEPLDEVCARGAKRATSNGEIGTHGEIICVCVLDGQQTVDVLLRTDGVLAAARPGTVIAVHSTTRHPDAACGRFQSARCRINRRASQW
jgi:3-hydroxyisobutyrate dehydrogenase